jgi:hypothetical protein
MRLCSRGLAHEVVIASWCMPKLRRCLLRQHLVGNFTVQVLAVPNHATFTMVYCRRIHTCLDINLLP